MRALKACGNRHRLRLLKAILSVKGGVRQNALVEALRLPQFLAARYLQALSDAGLIVRHRRGLAVLYRRARGASPEIRKLQRAVDSLPPEYFDIPPSGLDRLRSPR